MWQAEVKKVALNIRRRVFEHAMKNNGGYLSQVCSSADLLATFYLKILNIDPSIAPPIPRPFAGPPGANNPDSFTGAGYHGEKRSNSTRRTFHYHCSVFSRLR